jgi:hypothetical protein
MDINYLAGFFDGEGCITKGGDSTISIRVTQLAEHREPLDEFKKRYKGNISNTGNKNRPCLRWALNGTKAIKFLKDIFPLCVVKKRHIQLALCLLYMIKYRKEKNAPVDSGELWLRRRILAELKRLNRRVPISPTIDAEDSYT